ncbi:MAG: hypothetical protein J3Q66DRAFT_374551 [Benniella sp.]|nr:MAG: hypothetical protein J3Q66DRAFT_374551 [Benniella sp.]
MSIALLLRESLVFLTLIVTMFPIKYRQPDVGFNVLVPCALMQLNWTFNVAVVGRASKPYSSSLDPPFIFEPEDDVDLSGQHGMNNTDTCQCNPTDHLSKDR